MKMSPSFKVGILTLVALIILLFTVLWIKGRSFSSAERIEVHFKDVNGMRPGSGVQMMGLRVGQVEEIIPVVDYQTFAVAENRHFAIFRTAYFPKFVEEDVLLKVKNMNLSSGFS